MANNAKLRYLSTWIIDQLTARGEVSIGAGTTALLTIDPSTPFPVFELQFNVNSSGGAWFNTGVGSTNNAQSGLFTFYGFIQGNTLYVVCSIAGRVRYNVWSDKVNY